METDDGADLPARGSEGALRPDGPIHSALPVEGAEQSEELRKLLDALPERTRMFVVEYLADPTSIRAAARRAWPDLKPGTCNVRGSVLLRMPAVQRVVALAMNQRADRTMVTIDRVVHESAIIAFSNVADYVIDPERGTVEPAEGIPSYVMRAVRSIKHQVTVARAKQTGDIIETTHKVELTLWDKNASQRLLAEHMGMLVRRIAGPNGEPLESGEAAAASLGLVRDIIRGVVGHK